MEEEKVKITSMIMTTFSGHYSPFHDLGHHAHGYLDHPALGRFVFHIVSDVRYAPCVRIFSHGSHCQCFDSALRGVGDQSLHPGLSRDT